MTKWDVFQGCKDCVTSINKNQLSNIQHQSQMTQRS